MNCPNCSSSNFADAVECRNCEAPLEAPPDTSKKWRYGAWAAGFLVVGSMLIFALKQPTSVVKCTEFSAQIEAYEASPLWRRDKGMETWRRRQAQDETRLHRQPLMWSENERCYASVPQTEK